jgi:hypothetical protein
VTVAASAAASRQGRRPLPVCVQAMASCGCRLNFKLTLPPGAPFCAHEPPLALPPLGAAAPVGPRASVPLSHCGLNAQPAARTRDGRGMDKKGGASL